jgi:hypothetical protein
MNAHREEIVVNGGAIRCELPWSLGDPCPPEADKLRLLAEGDTTAGDPAVLVARAVGWLFTDERWRFRLPTDPLLLCGSLVGVVPTMTACGHLPWSA